MSNNPRYDVYGIGNALLDIQCDTDYSFLQKHKINKGLMTYVPHERQDEIISLLGDNAIRQISPGGSVANSMIVLEYFGGTGFYSCRIANDSDGDQYYQAMKQAGLDSNYDTTERVEGQTGRCLVKITPDADRTMSTFLGASIKLCEDQLNYEAIKQSKFLYIEGYLMTSPCALSAIIKARDVAKAAGVKVAITLSDPNIVANFKQEFHEVIDEGVDLIFCNEAEALEFTDTTNLQDAEEALKKVTKTFVITIGPRGSLVFDGQSLTLVAATEEKPIDTLGAGDMYAGAFLYGITHGLPWAAAGHLANITSSKVVTIYGPRISQQDAKELLHQLKKEYIEAA